MLKVKLSKDPFNTASGFWESVFSKKLSLSIVSLASGFYLTVFW